MSKQNEVIPEAAITAATKILFADKMSNHSGDNAPQIIDACEAVVRKILEAAAPYMLAEAWDTGGDAAIERENAYGSEEKAKFSNPYRTKDAS